MHVGSVGRGGQGCNPVVDKLLSSAVRNAFVTTLANGWESRGQAQKADGSDDARETHLFWVGWF